MTLRRAPALNLPNQLTVLRLGMCGLLIISMSLPWPYAATASLIIFVIASLTDWLDGEIARSRNLITDLGKLLDPLADKVLILGTLIALAVEPHHLAPMWMVVVILAREFLISGLRQIAAAKQKILAAEKLGKHKTAWQMIAAISSLGWLTLSEFDLQNTPAGSILLTALPWVYWIALLLTVISGAFYFAKNASLVSESMEKESLTADAPAAAAVVKAEEAATPAPLTATPAPGQPAFKEWEAIVEALGHGAQIIILRKGGIAEGRQGFQAKHPKFWLFPTAYHQQWEKTKPELTRFLAPNAVRAATDPIALQYFAEVTDTVYLDTWDKVTRLADAHFWNDDILKERFDYADRPGMEPGLHLLLVRVSRINLPHKLAPSKDYDGCKSWIDLPTNWDHDIATHVVRSEEFATRRSRILAAVGTVAVSSSTRHLPKITKLTPRPA
jgi:CDP-diacylglycerol--glycerol-3-phosphate 3-phosphatidyltransferase